MATSPQKRGRRPKAVALERMRTIVWFRACQRDSGAASAAAMQKQFFPDTPEITRSLQRYSHGSHTPRFRVKGGPGIVSVLEKRCPGATRAFFHPVWLAIDPRRIFDTTSADRVFDRLPWRVLEHLCVYDSHTRVREWNWGSLRDPVWLYPSDQSTISGFLAAYLLVWRIFSRFRAEKVYIDNATMWIRHTLEALPECPDLSCVAQEMADFVEATFLKPVILVTESANPGMAVVEPNAGNTPRTGPQYVGI